MDDLFLPIVEDTKQHPNFRRLLADYRKSERDLFNGWADGFIDRDGKIVREFQTSFNSSFWEVYLYAAFKQYGLTSDWSHAAPDFSLKGKGVEFVVEAVTANAAVGKPNEWDRTFSAEELAALKPLKPINTEAIIRLSNALLSKSKKYEQSYINLDHVKGRPFVVAVAPFEQPHFQVQYDRPIRALLYDYYVDEDTYLENPKAYPNGAPAIALGHVTKENGADVPLGLFTNGAMAEVSAVIFSCTATWGKVSSMCPATESKHTMIRTMWATPPDGKPVWKTNKGGESIETMLDGLQIYHNPFARHPLPPAVLRADRVVQHYRDQSGNWIYESRTDALLQRRALAFTKRSKATDENI